MSETLTWRKAFKQDNIDFLSGNVTVYNSSVDTPWLEPITVAGDYATIAHMAAENNLYIIPEAQDMTHYNGTGRATVTLSPTRNDVRVTLANEELDVNVTNEELDVNITNEELDVNVVNAEDFPSGGGSGTTLAEVTIVNNFEEDDLIVYACPVLDDPTQAEAMGVPTNTPMPLVNPIVVDALTTGSFVFIANSLLIAGIHDGSQFTPYTPESATGSATTITGGPVYVTGDCSLTYGTK